MDQPRNLPLRLTGELPIIAIALALFALCTTLLAGKGIWPKPDPIMHSAWLFVLSIVAAGSIDAGAALMRHRPPSPSAFLLARYTAPGVRDAA
ncbi:MAG: hypothetical protein ACKO1N_01180 [Erythrobacter sp.]